MDLLIEILLSIKPSTLIKENEDVIFSLVPDLKLCKGFEQNNIWHIYDVYEHILHVVDLVDNNIILRMAALFHDIGKVYTYKIDENNIGHFYNHWNKSNEIFLNFSNENNLDKELVSKVSKLIIYHDIKFDKINADELNKFIELFNKEEIKLLFDLKRCDLLSQNKKFHYILDDYKNQEKSLIEKYY